LFALSSALVSQEQRVALQFLEIVHIAKKPKKAQLFFPFLYGSRVVGRAEFVPEIVMIDARIDVRPGLYHLCTLVAKNRSTVKFTLPFRSFYIKRCLLAL
jgi:hypothetical protein